MKLSSMNFLVGYGSRYTVVSVEDAKINKSIKN